MSSINDSQEDAEDIFTCAPCGREFNTALRYLPCGLVLFLILYKHFRDWKDYESSSFHKTNPSDLIGISLLTRHGVILHNNVSVKFYE